MVLQTDPGQQRRALVRTGHRVIATHVKVTLGEGREKGIIIIYNTISYRGGERKRYHIYNTIQWTPDIVAMFIVAIRI